MQTDIVEPSPNALTWNLNTNKKCEYIPGWIWAFIPYGCCVLYTSSFSHFCPPTKKGGYSAPTLKFPSSFSHLSENELNGLGKTWKIVSHKCVSFHWLSIDLRTRFFNFQIFSSISSKTLFNQQLQMYTNIHSIYAFLYILWFVWVIIYRSDTLFSCPYLTGSILSYP